MRSTAGSAAKLVYYTRRGMRGKTTWLSRAISRGLSLDFHISGFIL